MFPTENDMHRLVELRVRHRVLEWLTAEVDHILDKYEAFNASWSWMDRPNASMVPLDTSALQHEAEVLDWLYAETLWEELHLEERIRASAEWYPQNLILSAYLEDEEWAQKLPTAPWVIYHDEPAPQAYTGRSA